LFKFEMFIFYVWFTKKDIHFLLQLPNNEELVVIF